MNIPYPKPHPPHPAPSGTAVDKLVNTPDAALVEACELHYHKGLKHNAAGQVLATPFKSLREALDTHTPQSFRNIQIGGVALLTNPQGGLANDRETAAGWHFELPSPPEQAGKKETTAAEMIELYWMALCRDVEFTKFDSDSLIAEAASELKTLKLYPKQSTSAAPQYETRNVPAKLLFRGGDWTSGAQNLELKGPYLSQFLLHPIPFGTLRSDQIERRARDADYRLGGTPHMMNLADWRTVQDGGRKPHGVVDVAEAKQRYIQNMGDLARYVHIDVLYEAFLNAALILAEADNTAVDEGNPYSGTGPTKFKKEMGFGTFGGPHIFSLVTEVATRALKAVWYQKWIRHLRLRPEAYAGIVQRALTDPGDTAAANALGAGLPVLNGSAAATKGALKKILAKHGTYLLPMCFYEGSPTHPAYGAGHATVSGACVTVLKAYFAGTQTLKNAGITPMVPKPSGKELTAYTGTDAAQLTVAGELDKLASNIAIGRNMAGVHWHSDYSQSVLLGQRIATSMLYHKRRDYHERPWSLSYRTFGGKVVEIHQDRVVYDGDEILDRDDDLDPATEAAKLKAIV